jgi:uncharacterized protein GlcG (DUF336 family)
MRKLVAESVAPTVYLSRSFPLRFTYRPPQSPMNKKGTTNMPIDLQTAETIVAGARATATTQGFRPLSVVVLDAGGHIVLAQRQDGASIKRFDIAFGKAYGALSLGVDSRDLMERAEQQPYFIGSVTSAIGGSLVPVPGGVLALDTAGNLVGAVGVSGDSSDNDEAAAVAGIHSAGLAISQKLSAAIQDVRPSA